MELMLALSINKQVLKDKQMKTKLRTLMKNNRSKLSWKVETLPLNWGFLLQGQENQVSA
jgi:hypothetical protein